ncbi:MAG: aldehyde dehydrogenase family protein [Deltaproteobacteria bacterium]|nr:aldehyde dehydrogenase family protein [Deltaproteobacteria bacterium]
MDIGSIVAAARAAQVAWARRPLAERGAIIQDIGRRFAARGEDVARVVCEETKKSPVDAWFADVVPNLDLFDYWGGEGLKAIAWQKAPLSPLKFPKKEGRLVFEPKGLVGLITPWNYPAALTLRSLIPALVAGNAVLYKPSEHAPRTGDLLAEIFGYVLPPGLVSVVHGAADAGRAVVSAADHVVFIGSVATGRKVAVQAAERLISTSLELGGKDAAIVLADCEPERTAAGVFWGAMGNSGQNCAAVERCYVERAIYPDFVKRLVDLASRAAVAPVATEAQDAVVRRHLDDARARGATLHGQYPGAIILEGVPADALIATEETFGPVLPVWPVDSAEDGLARANDSRYGLTTSLWTRDLERAEALAGQAQSGVVTINNTSFTAAIPFAPWSGRRDSGTGVTSSPLAIHELVRPKFVLVDKNPDPEVWWFPFDEGAVALAKRSLDWLTAQGLGKLGKTLGVLGAMKKRVAAQKLWQRGG